MSLLANPSRVRILAALASEGPKPLSELAKTLKMSPSATCNHLRRLVDAGALSARQDGRAASYALEDERLGALLRAALDVYDIGDQDL